MTPHKSYGFIRGCPSAGINNETFCIYTGAFWVRSVRLSLGSRKGELAGKKKQRTATLPAGTQTRTNYPQSVTRSPLAF